MIRVATASLILATLGGPAVADVAGSPTVADGAPDAWQPRDGDTIRFNVRRNHKSDFGTHTVHFSVDEEGNVTATSDVSLKAGLGPITLFRYSLTATEQWRAGQLVSLEGETNDDGDAESVEARRDGDMLEVSGSEFSGEVPLGIIPSSHWNIQQAYSDRILSTESGEILKTSATNMGRETIEAGGQQIEATRYRVVSDLTVDIWYDDQSRWVKLAFEARGQEIDYVLADLY